MGKLRGRTTQRIEAPHVNNDSIGSGNGRSKRIDETIKL